MAVETCVKGTTPPETHTHTKEKDPPIDGSGGFVQKGRAKLRRWELLGEFGVFYSVTSKEK